MVILGIDPGYGLIGYGILKTKNYCDFEVIDYGVIDTPKDKRLVERLEMIYKGIGTLIDKFKPDCVAMEELFFFRNYTTIIPVAEARGIILLACREKLGDNIFEYTPLQIKQALTGQGRAEKKQVQYMVKTILHLGSIPKPDDAADALAVAICHSQTNNNLVDNRA
jgi:crossover junction endodeoxyribonuclease RuvC